ncbi:hypothetical protein HPB51_028377 [Rhipicephalus microplus]|uniref:Serpin domain-containing protein n=1 Tax=Rhipicephalus microplus TaxID=6941 RepID=A0A9J6CXH0_RHIMP|nr:hypothetical protein HPB51_028377 [Rhipicephalus microplus]
MAVNQLGDSVLNFAIGLYGQLKPKDGRKKNIFFSPFSISAALSMALGGARNKTAKELSTVLRVPDDAQIHRHFSDFFSKLSSYAADVKLHIANRMYCEQTFPVLESYLSLLRDSYGATVEQINLKEVLKQMGINDFFSFDADLSAISEKDKLAASEVVHKAFVEVNEEGTEAAAATAVMMAACCLSSAPPQTYKFIVDRPFMFVIRSRDPDIVLFMGSVRDL